MLLKTAVFLTFVTFGVSQYIPCPNVLPRGVVLDLTVGECSSKRIICDIGNTTHVPFEFTFVSSVPAQNLSVQITLEQNGRKFSPYLLTNNICESVKCPIRAGAINKWSEVGGVTRIDKGLLKATTVLKDENDKIIFCVINPLLIVDLPLKLKKLIPSILN